MKIPIAGSSFSKRSILDVWQGSEYVSSSGYPMVLTMTLFLNVPEFCIYQSSEYACFKNTRILNMPGLHGVQNMPEQFLIYLNMPDHVWIYLNISEYAGYAWISLNLTEWLLFYISPVITSHYTLLLIWTSTEDQRL